jgi:hypothetical protein
MRVKRVARTKALSIKVAKRATIKVRVIVEITGD